MLFKFGGEASFILYGFRPILYAIGATAYHLWSQKLRLGTFFMHAGIFILINQLDMVDGMRKNNPEKWQEYTESKKNY